MRNIFILVLLSVMACAVRIEAQQDPEDRASREMQAALRTLDEQLPIVDFNAPKPTEPLARAKREAKDKRHDHRETAIAEGMGGMSTVSNWDADFPAIPVANSSTIVIGRISDARAHLSYNKSIIYSEIAMTVDETLKEESGIKPSLSIIAEREGGRTRFSSGAIFRYFVSGMGIPKVGHSYLLFLKRLDDGDFEILTGYELIDDRVVPLDDSGVVHFERYKDAEQANFLREVRNAISSRIEIIP